MHKNEERVAILLGGASKVGYATARLFIERGLRLAVIARDAGAEKVTDAVRGLGEGVAHYPMNFGSVAGLRDAVEGVAQRFGRIDILVNCVSDEVRSSLADTTESMWHDCMDAEIKAPFFTMQACAEHMRRTGGGRIVNLLSAVAVVADGCHALYATAKGALSAMTREWAVDLCNDNIQCNSVLPGSSPDKTASVIVFLALCAPAYLTAAQIAADDGNTAFWDDFNA